MDNMIPSNTMGANFLPQPQMQYGYATPCMQPQMQYEYAIPCEPQMPYGFAAPCVQPRGCNSFIIIIVLFILLIIIGTFAFCD
ncbi:YjcZ family sporulation protein [Neobacillus vireti]|uniref:YjcZ family sporulation protein n=1 Tax=Neobacillus vireti TaxID=220686 RepID=UPI002FFFDDE9